MSNAREKAVERLAAVLHNCPLGEMVISVCEREFSYLEPDHRESLRNEARRFIDALALVAVDPALVEAAREADAAAAAQKEACAVSFERAGRPADAARLRAYPIGLSGDHLDYESDPVEGACVDARLALADDMLRGRR